MSPRRKGVRQYDNQFNSNSRNRYGTIPQSRYERLRPFYPAIPSNQLGVASNHYAPSLYTDMDPNDDELPHAPPSKAPEPLPTSNSIPEEPQPDEPDAENNTQSFPEEVVEEVEQQEHHTLAGGRRSSPPSFLKHLGEELQLDDPIKQLQSPNQSFFYSKQHTGLKNLSFNVGAAVMPSASMEFEQDHPESFGTVKINRPARNALPKWEPHKIIGRRKVLRLDVPNPEKFMAMASKSAENLTDQGYLDLKFYHNKLW